MKKKDLFISNEEETIEHLNDNDSFQLNKEFDNDNSTNNYPLRNGGGNSSNVLIKSFNQDIRISPTNKVN